MTRRAQTYPSCFLGGSNLKLTIVLNVKFRAFGIDFADFSKTFTEPLGIPEGTIPPKTLLSTSTDGVSLTVSIS